MTFTFPNDHGTNLDNTFGEISQMFFYNPAGYFEWGVAGQNE